MKSLHRLAWPVVVVVSAAAVIVTWRGYAHARHDASHALRHSTMVTTHVRELERVRPLAAQWQERKRPESGLAASLGETLTGCGIPASVLANVTPQPATALQGSGGGMGGGGGGELKRQRATLTLTSITLPQLGSFLEAWRAREPYWTVASIEVSPDPRAMTRSAPGSDLPLTAQLALDVVYLDDAKEMTK